MSEPSCPGCGETEGLRGRPVKGDIEVTCERCGATWVRGSPRCRKCGRPDGVRAQQRMTRHPRGTLLAVIGVHEVTVCPDCDREVALAARDRSRPLPDGYRSRFVHGDAAAVPEPGTSARATHKERSSPSTYVGPVSSATERSAGPQDPTVRQATEAFLEQGEGTAGVAMVMLGAKLGPSTRLSRVSITGDELRAWIDATWGTGSGSREQVVAEIRSVFGYWRSRGWLEEDPGPALQ